MKVLYVLDSLFGGGTERSTLVLLPYLMERGVDPTLAVLRSAPDSDNSSVPADVNVVALDGPSFRRRVLSLRRNILSVRPDIVHTALFASDMVGRVAACRTDSLVLSSLVNTPYDPLRLNDPNVSRGKLRAVQLLDGLTSRLFADQLHAVSRGVAEANSAALHYPRSRIVTVERGRDRSDLGHWSLERRRLTRSRLGFSDLTPIILAVGRQEFQKAHVDLIRAAELLVDRHPDLVVLVAGPKGNASTAIQQAIASSSLPRDKVLLLGHRDDVADLIVAADVLALPSHWEGTAGSAVEALALRCPIVSTDLAGLGGVLTPDKTALVVSPARPDLFAEALHKVLSDSGLAARLAATGLEDFEHRFTLDRSADALVALYSAMAARFAKGQR